jgi:hypothetical protein
MQQTKANATNTPKKKHLGKFTAVGGIAKDALGNNGVRHLGTKKNKLFGTVKIALGNNGVRHLGTNSGKTAP